MEPDCFEAFRNKVIGAFAIPKYTSSRMMIMARKLLSQQALPPGL